MLEKTLRLRKLRSRSAQARWGGKDIRGLQD
jgi:hypothetical protein